MAQPKPGPAGAVAANSTAKTQKEATSLRAENMGKDLLPDNTPGRMEECSLEAEG